MTPRTISAARRAFGAAAAAFVSVSAFAVPAAQAGSLPETLTIEPLGWNVIGLDGTDVNAGPNRFPVGAEICNVDTDPATDVTVTFEFTAPGTYVNVSGPDTVELGTLAPSACAPAWFTVEVTRNAAAYSTARPFAISVTSPDAPEVSTPLTHELYVAPLTPESGLDLTNISGPEGPVYIGQEITLVVEGTTTLTYDQLVTAIVPPTDLLAIRSVDVDYASPLAETNDQFYADACGWENSPISVDYLSCVGPEEITGGLVGGVFRVEVVAEALASGTGSYEHLILVHDDTTILYNGDFDEEAVIDFEILKPVPSLQLDKVFTEHVDTDTDGVVDAGETLEWSVIATNTGLATLSDVIIADPLVEGSETCATLAPAAVCDVQAVYTVTEADVTAGEVTNEATAAGTSGTDAATAEASNTVDLNDPSAPGGPGVVLDKVYMGHDDTDTDGTVDEGETLSWMLVATNTGDVTLTDVTIEDALVGESFSCATLIPGGFCQTEVLYPAVSGDITAGEIANTATVTAQSPGGEVTGTDTDTRPVVAPGVAEADGMTVVKTLIDHDDTDLDGDVDAGEILTWTVMATNTGDMTVANVIVDDPLTGDSTSCMTVLPGAMCSMDTSYIVTEADVTAREVTNTASVTGDSPLGAIGGSATDTQDAGPSLIGLVKVFVSHTDTDDDGEIDAGEVLNWRVTATNNTDGEMTAVTITDPLTGDTKTCDTLAAGATCVLDTDYTVVAADVTAREVTNTASVVGTFEGDSVENDASFTYEFPAETDEETGAVTGGNLLLVLAIGLVLGGAGWVTRRRLSASAG